MTSLNLQSLAPQKGARRRKLRKGRGIAAGQGDGQFGVSGHRPK